MNASLQPILMTTDLTELSWEALDPAVELARTGQTRLFVLTVLRPSEQEEEENAAEGETERQSVARILIEESVKSARQNCSVEILVSTSKNAAAEIERQAERIGAKLIVLAVRNRRLRGRKDRLSEELIRNGRVPVLAVPVFGRNEAPQAETTRSDSELWMG